MNSCIRFFYAFLILIIFALEGNSQITYPIGDFDGQEIGTCSAYFTDSGADTLTFYQAGENYSITFCSSDPDDSELMKVYFNFFQLAADDILYIYEGEDDEATLLFSAGNSELHQKEIWVTSECIHFRFESDEESEGDLGWLATISCYTFCEGLWVEANTTTDRFEYCPYSPEVSFLAEAGYFADNTDYNPNNFIFTWTFHDDTQSGTQAYYTFDDSGAYPFGLKVEDTSNNCETNVINVIKIGTYPVFEGTLVNPDTICSGSQTLLNGLARAITWTGFPTSVTGVFPIPDGTGETFISKLDFDVFDDNAEITDEEDFDKVCLNIEHIDYGQLRIELESPTGDFVLLSDYSYGGANLGEPVAWDNTTPGKGYDYCFSPVAPYGKMRETTPQFHEYTDNAGNFYFNAPYLPSGTYTPEEPFTSLIGSPLNGEWKLHITDETVEDNGHLFEWSLFFREEIYPDSLIFTPNIVSEVWYDEEAALDGNPASVAKEEEGEHEFRFEVMDDFGCIYNTYVYLEVLPLPKAEILSELEIPVCEGDSTLLTIVPLNDSPYDWIYQWERNSITMEESIFDTIMAKETGNYAVLVTDTITGCMDLFDIELTNQNCDLTIPNVFTPNNDGINDYFEILNLEHYPNSRIVIFNRNGKKVFEHHDYDGNWWDGRGAPDGTYYYVLYYKRMGEEKNIHGTVTILR